MDATYEEDTLNHVMNGQEPDWTLETDWEPDCEPDCVASANASTTITPKGDDKPVNLVARTIPDFSCAHMIGFTFIFGGVRLGQINEVIQEYLKDPTYPIDLEGFRPLKGKWKLKGYQPRHEMNAAIMRLQVYHSESERLGDLFAVEVHRLNGDGFVAFNTFCALRSKCRQIPNAVEYSRDDLTPITPTEDHNPRWTYTPMTEEARERLISLLPDYRPPSQQDADHIYGFLSPDQGFDSVLAGASMCASDLLERQEFRILIGQNSNFRRRLFELLGNQRDSVDIKRCAAIALREIIPWIQASDLNGQGQSHPFHQLLLGQNRCDMFTRRVCQEILERVPELRF